jgi:hypothetical protein
MPLTTCGQCWQSFDDQELLCPYCGTAVIPQLSKAELRLETMKAREGPRNAILAGTGLGLVLGIGLLVIAIFRGEATPAHGAGILLLGMFGGACGMAVYYLWLRPKV